MYTKALVCPNVDITEIKEQRPALSDVCVDNSPDVYMSSTP